jgi:hypothetical protein
VEERHVPEHESNNYDTKSGLLVLAIFARGEAFFESTQHTG